MDSQPIIEIFSWRELYDLWRKKLLVKLFFFSDKSDQLTVLRFIPEFNEAWACLCKEYFNVPGWNFFLGLKVLPLSKNELKLGKFIFWEWQIFQDSRKLDIRLFLIFFSQLTRRPQRRRNMKRRRNERFRVFSSWNLRLTSKQKENGNFYVRKEDDFLC